MTDKVQKIREEVVRMHNLLPVMDGDNISVNYADRICTTLEMYIDSLQEEPKKCMYTKDHYTDEDRKVLCDGCEEECEFNKKEPVSEDLEEASRNYTDNEEYGDVVYFAIKAAFKAGAKWQAEQFEKNRLAACDRQAEEEAEIERDFVMGIIENEHRQPTFDDAIKYGMRLQKERMIAKAVDGVVTFDYYGGDKAYGCVAHDSFCLEDLGLKDMDEVKILILKK